jgi:hypothetical protein
MAGSEAAADRITIVLICSAPKPAAGQARTSYAAFRQYKSEKMELIKKICRFFPL